MMTTTIWRNYVGYRDLRAEMALAQRAQEGVTCAFSDRSLGASPGGHRSALAISVWLRDSIRPMCAKTDCDCANLMERVPAE